uniref:C2H2-type domain-containing protein n=1 Tax=Kalanchoe fedtschenkoi TaxID=63787 RepID=A0A7N0TWJ0_KALFE
MGVERELSESDLDSGASDDEAELNGGEKLLMQSDLASCVLHRKSVFRCRMCPKITCLSEETMKVHLNSKRHRRAEKQMKEGRLRFMLNSDGEIEEEAETHAERHARVLASTNGEGKKKNSKGGRQRQKLRKKVNNTWL